MPKFKFTSHHPNIYTKSVGFKLPLEDYLKLKKLVKKLSEERWGKERKKVTIAEFLRNLVKEVLENEKIYTTNWTKAKIVQNNNK